MHVLPPQLSSGSWKIESAKGRSWSPLPQAPCANNSPCPLESEPTPSIGPTPQPLPVTPALMEPSLYSSTPSGGPTWPLMAGMVCTRVKTPNQPPPRELQPLPVLTGLTYSQGKDTILTTTDCLSKAVYLVDFARLLTAKTTSELLENVCHLHGFGQRAPAHTHN